MRERISQVRLRPGQAPDELMLLKTYNTAMSTAAAELVERWAAGLTPPKPDGHLEVVKVVGDDRAVLGFNVYLVWAEPRTLGGKMPEEPEDEVQARPRRA